MKTDVSGMSPTTKDKIISQIQQLVPPGSAEPQDLEILATLKTLTADLIAAYQADGQLQEDPFLEVRDRTIHLYEAEIKSQLKGKVVLVTGGEGFVGSQLIKKIVDLGANRVISVDKVRCCQPFKTIPTSYKKAAVTFYAADVRNYLSLQHIFEVEKPDFVFHLSAQRLPGLAEIKVEETVTTGIIGTQNIIKLCEKFFVKNCTFSSTGKASRYFTTEVYAASKKIAEWQFAQAAQQGRVTYGMVRFTHMLENSSVCEQLATKVQQDKIVNVHAPHRYLTAQNVNEAVHLLLNTLVFAQRGNLKLLTVKNLGWPTETLEIALYKILESGKRLPIYFQGLIPGYEESFFLGQFDYAHPEEINLLINALEPQRVDDSGDIVISELAPFCTETMNNQLAALQALITAPGSTKAQIKQSLGEAIRAIVSSVFFKSSPEALLAILKWGVNPKQVKAGAILVESYRGIIGLLIDSLYGRLNGKVLEAAQLSLEEFDEIVAILATLPGIEKEVTYFKAVSRQIRLFEQQQNAIAPMLTTYEESYVMA